MAFTKKQNAAITATTDELKKIVAKIDPNGEAPIFTPYQVDGEYESDYSKTLLEKANERAREIWNGPQGYIKAKLVNARWLTPPPVKEGDVQVFAINQGHYPVGHVASALHRIFRIGQPYPPAQDGGWQIQQNIAAVIKKLKKLEKQGEEVVDDETRQRIMESVLMPSNQYGVFNAPWRGVNYVSLRYPQPSAVAKDLLTQEELNLVETIINYIARVRSIVGDYTASPSFFKEEDLLAPIVDDHQLKYSNPQLDTKMLVRMKKMADFFNAAIPYNLQQDMLPSWHHPRESLNKFEELKKASVELRNSSLSFLREEAELSELLEKVVGLSDALLLYFQALSNEVAAAFNLLTNLGISYTTFVKESKQRIVDSEHPW